MFYIDATPGLVTGYRIIDVYSVIQCFAILLSVSLCCLDYWPFLSIHLYILDTFSIHWYAWVVSTDKLEGYNSLF